MTTTPRATTSASPPPVVPRPGEDPVGHLVTGWEPYRPVADGIVRRFVHAYASSFVGPVQRLGGHVVRRDRYVVWDLGRPSGLFDGALLLQPLPVDGWPRVLAALEADLLPGGEGEVALFSPWPTPDLRDRGWRLAGHPPLLLRPQGMPEPPPPPWLEISAVTDAARLADWEHVAVTGYPFREVPGDRVGAMVDARILDDPRLHAWVAYVEGRPAAIGASYVAHGVNVFTLGVTLPEHRGRGLWHVLTRRRLAACPALPAVGLFSDHSRSPAEGLGFLPLERWTVWLRDRPPR